MQDKHDFEIAKCARDMKGQQLKGEKFKEEDWGGSTPVVIRAYHYDEEGTIFKQGFLLVGQALLQDGLLDEHLNVSDSDDLFPDGSDAASTSDQLPSIPRDYLTFLQGRNRRGSGPIYSFEPQYGEPEKGEDEQDTPKTASTIFAQESKEAILNSPFLPLKLVSDRKNGIFNFLDSSQRRHAQFRPLLSLYVDVDARSEERSVGLQIQDDLTRFYYLLQLKQRDLRIRFTSDEIYSILCYIEPFDWEPRNLLEIPDEVRASDEKLGERLKELLPEELDALRDMGLLLKAANVELCNWSADEVEEFFERRDKHRHDLLRVEHDEQIQDGRRLRRGTRKTVVKQI